MIESAVTLILILAGVLLFTLGVVGIVRLAKKWGLYQ